MPSALRSAASTGLSVETRLERARDARRDVLGARRRRRDEEHDHRVDAGIGEHERQRPPRSWRRSPSRACRRDWRGSPRRAAARRAALASRPRAPRARGRRPRTRPSRGCPRPPAFVRSATAVRAAAAASRAARPRRSAPRAFGAQDAGLVEERLDGLLPSRRAQRCASRPRARRRSTCRSSSPGSASFARPGPRSGAKRRGLPNDSR